MSGRPQNVLIPSLVSRFRGGFLERTVFLLDKEGPLSYTEAMITKITGKNQVTLPAKLVKTLGLTPGTELEWEIGPNRTLIATPRPTRAQRAAALWGAGRKYLRPGSDPVGDLIAERLQDEDEGPAAS